MAGPLVPPVLVAADLNLDGLAHISSGHRVSRGSAAGDRGAGRGAALPLVGVGDGGVAPGAGAGRQRLSLLDGSGDGW